MLRCVFRLSHVHEIRFSGFWASTMEVDDTNAKEASSSSFMFSCCYAPIAIAVVIDDISEIR